MKTETLLKEFFRYVILNICGMIGLSCYILADTFFISNGLGVNGLTALNLAIPIYSFIHGSGLMFGMGGATKYSIYRGQKEYKNADKSGHKKAIEDLAKKYYPNDNETGRNAEIEKEWKLLCMIEFSI